MQDHQLNQCCRYMVEKTIVAKFLQDNHVSPSVMDSWIWAGFVGCDHGDPPRVDLSLIASAIAVSKMTGVAPADLALREGIVVSPVVLASGADLIAEFVLKNRQTMPEVVGRHLNTKVKLDKAFFERLMNNDEVTARHSYAFTIAYSMMMADRR